MDEATVGIEPIEERNVYREFVDISRGRTRNLEGAVKGSLFMLSEASIYSEDMV